MDEEKKEELIAEQAAVVAAATAAAEAAAAAAVTTGAQPPGTPSHYFSAAQRIAEALKIRLKQAAGQGGARRRSSAARKSAGTTRAAPTTLGSYNPHAAKTAAVVAAAVGGKSVDVKDTGPRKLPVATLSQRRLNLSLGFWQPQGAARSQSAPVQECTGSPLAGDLVPRADSAPSALFGEGDQDPPHFVAFDHLMHPVSLVSEPQSPRACEPPCTPPLTTRSTSFTQGQGDSAGVGEEGGVVEEEGGVAEERPTSESTSPAAGAPPQRAAPQRQGSQRPSLSLLATPLVSQETVQALEEAIQREQELQQQEAEASEAEEVEEVEAEEAGARRSSQHGSALAVQGGCQWDSVEDAARVAVRGASGASGARGSDKRLSTTGPARDHAGQFSKQFRRTSAGNSSTSGSMFVTRSGVPSRQQWDS